VSLAGTEEVERAIELAKSADVVIFFAGVSSREGKDRENLSLAKEDNHLIE